jgi:hypothetical protein
MVQGAPVWCNCNTVTTTAKDTVGCPMRVATAASQVPTTVSIHSILSKNVATPKYDTMALAHHTSELRPVGSVYTEDVAGQYLQAHTNTARSESATSPARVFTMQLCNRQPLLYSSICLHPTTNHNWNQQGRERINLNQHHTTFSTSDLPLSLPQLASQATRPCVCTCWVSTS